MTRLFVGLFSFVGMILPVVSLWRPMAGVNIWRDGHTFGVIRNYVEEGIDILRPACDLRGLGSGILPSEFPFYNAASAFVMKFIGIDWFWARLTSFAFFGLMVWAGGRLLSDMTNDSKSYRYFWLMALVNTVLITQATAIMPEATLNGLLALSCLWGYWSVRKDWRWIFPCLLVLTLAALVKPPGACAAGFVSMLWLTKGIQKHGWKAAVSVCVVAFGLPLIAVGIWKHWTIQFAGNIYGGVPVTHHYHRDFAMIWSELTLEHSYHALKKTVLHGLGLAGGMALLYGWFKQKAMSRKKWWLTPEKLALLAWVGLNFVFLLAAGLVQKDQTYYAAPVALPLTIFGALFIRELPMQVARVCLVVQLIAVSWFWENNHLNGFLKWEEVRQVAKEVDEFSSRRDLFLVVDGWGYFPPMNLIGRRGYLTDRMDEVRSVWRDYKFVYLPIGRMSMREDLESFVGKPFKILADHSLVYRIK